MAHQQESRLNDDNVIPFKIVNGDNVDKLQESHNYILREIETEIIKCYDGSNGMLVGFGAFTVRYVDGKALVDRIVIGSEHANRIHMLGCCDLLKAKMLGMALGADE